MHGDLLEGRKPAVAFSAGAGAGSKHATAWRVLIRPGGSIAAAQEPRPCAALRPAACLYLMYLGVPERRSRKKVCWRPLAAAMPAARGPAPAPHACPLCSTRAPARWSGQERPRGHLGCPRPCVRPRLKLQIQGGLLVWFPLWDKHPLRPVAHATRWRLPACRPAGLQPAALSARQQPARRPAPAPDHVPFAPPAPPASTSVVWLGPLFLRPSMLSTDQSLLPLIVADLVPLLS